MTQLYKKLSNNFILVPLIILITITGYYFYYSYTEYSNAQKSVEISKQDISAIQYLSDWDDKEHSIFYLMQSHIDKRIQTEENAMMFSALTLFFLLLFVLSVKSIFFKIARENNNLKNILKQIKNNHKLKKEYDLNELSRKEDKTELYEFLEEIITELEENTLLAEKANKVKSLFLANMSHEIRTPLNGIVGFADLLRSSKLDTEQEEYVQIIQKSSDNLLSIIKDILDISKIESEKVEIENIEFDPILEFESGIESYGAKASEKQIDLAFFIDPTLSNKLIGDPDKIKQVLVNLISNAVKFTPNEGTIDIRIEKVISINGESTVKFSVKDSGIGINSDQRKKIFEAFSQADSSTSRKYGGTGLGLTISKKLTQLMGGNLDLESEESQGSTFFFTLKFEEVSSVVKNQTIENLSVGYYLPHRDQAKQSGKYIETYISYLSPNYRAFDTIESLLSLEPSAQPDLIFVDFDYIDRNGIEQLNSLKSKILLLTTLHQKDQANALNGNFFKTLYAPINFSKINKSFFDVKNEEFKKDMLENEENEFFDIKVLVAEDNVINQKLIELSLGHFDIDVVIANNGKEAYELRCTQEFDLILMDYQMPVMNGIEATRAIIDYEKKNDLIHIPIVALTANALKGDKERFLAQGMDDYISKPIKLNTIKNILNVYFSDRSMSSQNNIGTSEKEMKESVDILLCKKEKGEQGIFSALLNKIGYSVDSADNLEVFKEMLESKNYTYVLVDKSLSGLSEDIKIKKIMKNSSIKSILFVEDRQSIREEDQETYTRVVLNTANMKYLEHVIKST